MEIKMDTEASPKKSARRHRNGGWEERARAGGWLIRAFFVPMPALRRMPEWGSASCHLDGAEGASVALST